MRLDARKQMGALITFWMDTLTVRSQLSSGSSYLEAWLSVNILEGDDSFIEGRHMYM